MKRNWSVGGKDGDGGDGREGSMVMVGGEDGDGGDGREVWVVMVWMCMGRVWWRWGLWGGEDGGDGMVMCTSWYT